MGRDLPLKDYRTEGPGRYGIHDAPRRRVHPPLPAPRAPEGFHRIRHYGLLATAMPAANLAQARELLDMPEAEARVAAESDRSAARPPATMPVLRQPHADHRRDLQARPPSSLRRHARPPRSPRHDPERHPIDPASPHRARASGWPAIVAVRATVIQDTATATPSRSCPPRRARLPASVPPSPRTGQACGWRCAQRTQSQDSRNPHRPRPGPRGTPFPGGFRTPAPAPTPKSRWARHPKPFTHTDMQGRAKTDARLGTGDLTLRLICRPIL